MLRLAGLLGVAGCAAAGPGAEVPPPPPISAVQVLVRLAPAFGPADPDRIVREAVRASGVPVRYVAATSPRWHSLALTCPDAPSCDAALKRLAGDTAHFDAVERDGRRHALSD